MAKGHIRTVNLRGSGISAEEGETIIRADRSNPVLGNPFHMANRSMQERERVIALSNARVEKDLARGGPISKVLSGLAARVADGEQIALQCWCAPLPCHCDKYVEVVLRMADELINNPAAHQQVEAKDLNRPVFRFH